MKETSILVGFFFIFTHETHNNQFNYRDLGRARPIGDDDDGAQSDDDDDVDDDDDNDFVEEEKKCSKEGGEGGGGGGGGERMTSITSRQSRIFQKDFLSSRPQ